MKNRKKIKKYNNKYGGFIVEENKEIPYDIKFSLINPKNPPSDEACKLFYEIEETNSKIKKIFENDPKELKRNFKLLLSLAEAGLVGEVGNPKIAKQALKNLKYDILVGQGKKIKTKYITEFGKSGIYRIILLMILFFYFKEKSYSIYFLVAVGAIIGSWVSFCTRKLEIDFEDLVNFEKDLMPFNIRITFIGLVSVIFSMLLKNEILLVSFGEFSLKDLFLSNEKSVLFGILCGILDTRLAVNLYKKTELILSLKGETNGRL